MRAAAVDWGQLGQLVWIAAAASVAVAITFALLILGATRAADMRREHRATAANAYLAFAALVTVVFAGGVILGVAVIVAK
jgi:hypothetical protein